MKNMLTDLGIAGNNCTQKYIRCLLIAVVAAVLVQAHMVQAKNIDGLYFDVEPAALVNSMNKSAAKFGLPFFMFHDRAWKNNNEIYTYVYADKAVLVITGGADEDGTREVAIVGRDINIVAAFGCLTAALSPKMTPDERGALLKELGLSGGNIAEAGEAVREGVRYWMKRSEGVGLWLGASPVQE